MNLETMFQHMLEKTFRIHSRPSDFTQQLLRSVFGPQNAKKSRAFHLALAPGDSGSTAANPEKRMWISALDRKDKRHERGHSADHRSGILDSPLPDTISAKAAERLGISSPSKLQDLKALSQLGNLTAQPVRVQSPGLVLHPSTFIPIPPTELEMHACKHMHVLLGCKVALGQFIFDLKGEDGKPLVSQREFNDVLWDYQCFMRSRFGWPSHIGGRNSLLSREASKSEQTAKFSTFRTPGASDTTIFGRSRHHSAPVNVSHKFEDLTHIRTLKVFHAFKQVTT